MNKAISKCDGAQSPTLKEMGQLWAGMLGVARVEPDDNFAALGGHSLLAVKLIAEVRERFGMGDELAFYALSECPTLGAFFSHCTQLLEPSEEQGQI